jgi:hypothetical protein
MGAAERILESSERTRDEGLLQKDVRDFEVIRTSTLEADRELVLGVRKIFGEWLDFGFTSPEAGWDITTKAMVIEERARQDDLQDVQLESKL